MASNRPQITKELSEAAKNLICPSNDQESIGRER